MAARFANLQPVPNPPADMTMADAVCGRDKLDLSPIQFMILAQAIIFLLGWPLERTEIIVIFVPIFIPLLTHFNVDPVLLARWSR